ncbi:MAG: DMT family transporter [Eubacteriales bacterium]
MPGQNKMKESTARWFVLFAAVMWGSTGTAQSFAPEGASPETIGAMRLLIGGAVLLIIAAKMGVLKNLRGIPVLVTVIAAASNAAYQFFFFAGVAKTGVAVGTVITIGSAPVLTGILGFLARGERPGRRWLAATVLAVLGCGLLFSDGTSLKINYIGITLALSAGLSYAVYSVALKQLIERYPRRR